LPPDSEFVRRAQAGDKAAFGELVQRHQRRAVAVARRLLGDTEDALEVTQDAFLKGFMSIGTLQNPDAYAGWQMRIVSNLSLNFRRGRKGKSALPLDDLLPGGMQTLRRVEGHETGEEIKKALDKLPEKQRLAIILFTMEEMPQKEVAEALDCSVEAVKWHVFQARKNLKTMLKDYL